MKYLKKFSSLSDANTQGASGLYSPHVDIIDGFDDVVNYAMLDGETFVGEFDENGI